MTNTFRQYAELFLRTRPITPRTAQDYRILLSSVILPAWGDRDLTSIKASELRVWLTQLWQRAPHQARRSRVILRGIFELAEDDGIIDKNPTTRLRIRTPPRATPRVLTVDQINKLIDAMPTERDRLLTSVLAYGGLRYGEATALAPHDVAGIGLTVRRSVQPAHGGGWLWGDTKPTKNAMSPYHQSCWQTSPGGHTHADITSSYSHPRRKRQSTEETGPAASSFAPATLPKYHESHPTTSEHPAHPCSPPPVSPSPPQPNI